MKVYHFGYEAYGVSRQIEQLMQNERVLLIDTRLKPYSWRPDWRGEALKTKYGKRYRPAGQYLGNENYQGGPIKIIDLHTGLKGLKMYLQEGHDLILLCKCAHTECHRYVILEALHNTMPEVEIVSPDECSGTGDTILCLSVMQPWCHLIIHKFKDVENRIWTTGHRGPLLLHAGARYDGDWFGKKDDYISQIMVDRFGLDGYVPYKKKEYPVGAIVGRVDLVDVVTKSDSSWFAGKYGFVLKNAYAFSQPIPYKGALKLFPVPLSVVEKEISL